MCKGVIEHIRPRVVIIAQELADETVKHWRIERFYLQDWIYDKALQAAISKWERSKYLQKKVTKRRRVEPDATQTIYGLTDPRDGLVFYVGVTSDVERRFQQHIDCSDFNFKKNTRIQDILDTGLYPGLIVLEENIDAVLAGQRETRWIQHYRDLDAPLTNFTKMQGVSDRDTW